MRHLGKFIVDFLREEEGPTAVEYAVMLALIIVVCVAAIAIIGNKTSRLF
jgi:pilus assembly protein Flp/PilA